MNKRTKIDAETLQRIREKYANKGYDDYGFFEVIKAADVKQKEK
jgi:hypothetical protein